MIQIPFFSFIPEMYWYVYLAYAAALNFFIFWMMAQWEIAGFLTSKIDVVYKDEAPFKCKGLAHAKESRKDVVFIRIRVENAHPTETLHNCLAVITKIECISGESKKTVYEPCAPLGTTNQHLEKREKGRFILRPNQFKYIEVAELNTSDPSGKICLKYEHEAFKSLLPGTKYYLTISVYGDNTGPETRRCTLEKIGQDLFFSVPAS